MLIGALGDLPDAELPPCFHERLRACLQAERRQKEGDRVKRKLNLPALSAAAAGLLVLVLGAALALGGNVVRLDSYVKTQGGIAAGDEGYAGSDTTNESAGGILQRESPQTAPDSKSEEDRAGSDGGTLTSDVENAQGAVAEGRKIIYTAEVGVRTRRFDEDLATVRQACDAAGGYVESAYIYGVSFAETDGAGRTAVITVRIPQSAYNAYLGAVTGVGQMISNYEYTQDITANYFDSQTRLATLELQLERLEEILGKSEKLEDVILLVQEIASVTNEMEQIKGQLRLWDQLIDYSRVSVTLTEVQESTYMEPTDPTLADRIAVAFYGTLNGMKRGLQSFAVWLVGAVPWIILLAALACVAVAVTVPLARRRRRAARVLPPEKKE